MELLSMLEEEENDHEDHNEWHQKKIQHCHDAKSELRNSIDNRHHSDTQPYSKY
jgi:hypothetical protein